MAQLLTANAGLWLPYRPTRQRKRGGVRTVVYLPFTPLLNLPLSIHAPLIPPTHLSSSPASTPALAGTNLLGPALDLFGEGPGTERPG